MDIEAELMNLDYRELSISMKDLFPNVDMEKVYEQYKHLIDKNPHQTLFNVARELWNGGYDSILKEHGFYDKVYPTFSGHCHQCTPVLGLVLKALNFDVSYLECYRIKESYLQTGIIAQVPPEEEPDEDKKEEFCSIKRIPYCCLETIIDGKPYYLTGKHLKPKGESAVALLSPECYADFTGVFSHQDDEKKSGIYLKIFVTDNRTIWFKQTAKDPDPELFASYLRMKL